MEEHQVSAILDLEIERRLLRDRRTIVLTGEVDATMARAAVEDLTILAETPNIDSVPITIIMNSPGGHVEYGIAIIEAIRHCQRHDVKVVGVVMGHAMSMMSYILQACDKRICGRFSWLMVHGFSGSEFGADKQNHKAQGDLLEGLTTQAAELYTAANTSKGHKECHDQEHWEKILDSNLPQFYSAVQALDIGLIDEIEGDDVCQPMT
jgi:ATP-dependent protease ClpP protease subunit